MNRLSFVLSSRGISNTFRRSFQISARFGISPRRMEKRLLRYIELVQHFGSKPSLPITACVLGRNPHIAKNLIEIGAELCVHGLYHNDLSSLPIQRQRQQISRAIEIFNRYGIAFRGFRSPYLRYNEDTLRVVEELGFDYDSNLAFFWSSLKGLQKLSPHEQDGLMRGLEFYRPATFPEERSLPRLLGRVVEIPVSLPDDEILLDRMGFSPERIGEIWKEMLNLAIERHELFTIQLHPERIDILGKPLEGVLEVASSSSVWLAPMQEISDWWRKRATTEINLVRESEDTYIVPSNLPPEIDIELFDPGKGEYRDVQLGKPLRASQRPVIGVEKNQVLVNYLKEIGYLSEIKRDNEDYSILLKPSTQLGEIDAIIRQATGRLLRIKPWPKGYQAGLAVTGDIDCLTIGDFVRRFWEA